MTNEDRADTTAAGPRRIDSIVEESLAEAEIAAQPEEEVRKRILRISRGLLLVGVASLVFHDFLDPVWGGMLVIGGVVGLFLRHRGAFLAFGIALLIAALMNIISLSPGWIILGLLQIGWAIREFKCYRSFAGEQSPDDDDEGDATVRASKHSRLGIASLVLAAPTLAGITVGVVAAMSVPGGLDANAETLDPTSAIGVFGGFFGFVSALVAVGLGIAGIVQRRRRRTLAIIGLSVHLPLVLFVIWSMTLGYDPAQETPFDDGGSGGAVIEHVG